jgi:hypothetical protein
MAMANGRQLQSGAARAMALMYNEDPFFSNGVTMSRAGTHGPRESMLGGGGRYRSVFGSDRSLKHDREVGVWDNYSIVVLSRTHLLDCNPRPNPRPNPPPPPPGGVWWPTTYRPPTCTINYSRRSAQNLVHA